MAQTIRRRRQQAITQTTFGGRQIIPLGLGMLYREIYLRWFGTLTYAAAANNDAAGMNRGDEWGLIDRIDLVGNGSTVIRSFRGMDLLWFNRVIYNNSGRRAADLGDAAATAVAFDSSLILPLWQFLTARPMDTVLDSSKYSDLRLEITFAAAAAVTIAPGAAPTALTATLEVCSYESFGVEGNFSECFIFPLQLIVPGAAQQVDLRLPVGPLYRGFMINAAAGGVPTSADAPNAITNVQIYSGTQFFWDYPWATCRDIGRQRIFQFRDYVQNAVASPILTHTAPVYMRNVKSTLADEDAWAFLDLVGDGYLGESIDTIGFSELVLRFATSSAATITVYPIQIYPTRNAPPMPNTTGRAA
jgi:hypothetical protein